MKKNLHLTASVDKPELLEDIVEKLATRRYDIGYNRAKVPNSWDAIETSTVESYLSGTVEFDYNDRQRIRIPYITCFLFSCTKTKNDPYDLSWSISLS
ncbi:MAG TPA: hypothetical protein VKH37_09935 [Ferruginibacter sp.]|nr:hypothetical protein [Ferruginibacter sp.]